ncbi:MAG: peptidylprolyl isomerase [Candidatus Magasanikbacteria bacterium CG10_big_fil_rev_8_21_14_0_10_47_10]|uniref:Peptidyl-prolyl cis-trans isomerase n=1 Tax=Candidatus Magasanikbacteria bacterium CG10_big_fil_rev_8_21_14_0_10_47_10 TaxID=1974652 RepID=A0A2H0TQI4_9BACT|nr:MAG: peptidylprolyl isomerase [Candidatus Magasanikbacteria bacterium CG10_big_fil_rev_8_21_14_0_10_47_10]
MKRTRDGQEDLAQQYGKAILHTTKGDISVQFYADESPVTVNNFMHLAQEGFYDGTAFHRVIKDFMIQGGDPLSRDKESGQLPGSGGPGYAFEDEFNNHRLVRGSLAMANAGPNTNGSQFFIVTAAETPWLDRRHTNFGEVIAGMNVVDSIENTAVDSNDNPTDPIVITSVELQ